MPTVSPKMSQQQEKEFAAKMVAEADRRARRSLGSAAPKKDKPQVQAQQVQNPSKPKGKGKDKPAKAQARPMRRRAGQR